jgi:hypothetical protein
MSVVTSARRPEQSSWSDRFMYGLLVVQIIVGFEFFWSVMVKLVRGGFVSGLAANLEARVQVAPAWYSSFAHSVVIPHASTFGYLIIAGELFVGVTLIAAAIVWLAGWHRLGPAGRITLSVLSLLAAAGALLMNLNYHIANGAPNPWQLPVDPFSAAVDVDMILVLVDATLAVVMGSVLVSLVRSRRAEPAFETTDAEAADSRRLAA